jgi:hypothetical protein
MSYHRKKLIVGLLALLLVFGLVFFAALANFSRNLPTIAIGLPPLVENGLIMILCVASLIKIIYELIYLERTPHAPGSGTDGTA